MFFKVKEWEKNFQKIWGHDFDHMVRNIRENLKISTLLYIITIIIIFVGSKIIREIWSKKLGGPF